MPDSPRAVSLQGRAISSGVLPWWSLGGRRQDGGCGDLCTDQPRLELYDVGHRCNVFAMDGGVVFSAGVCVDW